MVRNTLSVFALLLMAASTQAGVIAVTTRIGGGPDGAAFTTPENQAASDLNALTSGGQSQWISYALGVKSTAGEKISAIDVAINTAGPNGGLHQRWTFDADGTGAYTLATPSSNNLTNGDSHLANIGSVVGVAPTENRIAKTSDGATTTVGFNTPHLGVVTDNRNYGIGTTMAGAWGYDAAQQLAQVAGNVLNFAYIVIPRAALTGPEGFTDVHITVNAATTLTDGGAGPTVLLTNADFFVPEPATMSLIGLCLVGFGFIRRRS